MQLEMAASVRVTLAAVSVAFLSGCAGLTYGTGVSTSTQTVRDVVGIVDFMPNEREPIDYRPRAGLVSPPSANLPPPADPTTTALANFPKNETGAQFVTMPASGAARGGTVDAAGQPMRQYLTEPPTDYRTPSPDAPMAIAPAPEQRRRFDLRALWPF